ncbi:MAG: phosphopyruvate hydratase [Candidatus Woesearchaeota archaeon]
MDNIARLVKLLAREVLDSRGNPTLEVEAFSAKYRASAIVPSGTSTGKYEAIELRDGKKRYFGKGVQCAVENVALISRRLKGMQIDQERIDHALLSLDGTENKSRLGANAILGVSMAVARLCALENHIPLYEYISKISNSKPLMPLPFANVINGGKHAGTRLKMQEFIICPIGAKRFSHAAEMVSETYHLLKEVIKKRYGVQYTNVGDEGGFVIPVEKAEEALFVLEASIEQAGYKKEIRIALDAAASEFYNQNGLYLLHRQFTSEQLIEYYLDLVKSYKIISFEDPFDQDDFTSYNAFTKKSKIQVVGDDLLVTNPSRISIAVQKRLCNALLLKVNQIGTLTEAVKAAGIAKKAGWKVMVSHRSGETEDAFISDLAVGLGCGQIKLGAPCRGERTAKYNQLLRIEEFSNARLIGLQRVLQKP